MTRIVVSENRGKCLYCIQPQVLILRRAGLGLELYLMWKAPRTTLCRSIVDLRNVHYHPSAAMWSNDDTKTEFNQRKSY